MKLAQQICSLVHSLRKKHRIKVRQPLMRILIPVLNDDQKEQISKVSNLIKSETNVKEIEFVDDTSGVLVKKVKPNFRKLGKEFGSRMKEVAAAIGKLNPEQIRQVESTNAIEVQLGSGESITLERNDLEISFEDIPGWTVAADGEVTVALDLTITESLREEGLARDVVNRIQNIRKESGLDVQDKITIEIETHHDLVSSALKSFDQYICEETQANEILVTDKLNDGEIYQIDDFELKIRIKK